MLSPSEYIVPITVRQRVTASLHAAQVAAAAASVGGGFAAMKGSLGSWGTYLKGQADKVGETVAARAGSSPLAAGRPTTASSPNPVSSSSQRSVQHSFLL